MPFGKQIITPAMRELRTVLNELQAIADKEEISKRDETRVNALVAKAAALRDKAVAPDDYAKRWFCAFMKGGEVPQAPEHRANLIAGTQTLSYGTGSAGGFLVPNEFYDDVKLGMAQYDPILDSDVVTVDESDSFALRPIKIPAWKLDTYAATQISEGAQQNTQSLPALAQLALNSYTFRCSLGASYEFENDDFQQPMKQLATAFGIGLARGIGAKLVTGTGTAEPQGILAGAANSSVTTASGTALVFGDITDIFFSVNRFYRASPKCAWGMSDATYKLVRNAKDSNNRPLISIKDDKEVLMGKPVYILPTMPSGAGTGRIIFGDFSYYIVRLSKLMLQRSIETPGFVEKGLGLYTALLRVDAGVLEPTGGNTPAIVYASLHA